MVTFSFLCGLDCVTISSFCLPSRGTNRTKSDLIYLHCIKKKTFLFCVADN